MVFDVEFLCRRVVLGVVAHPHGGEQRVAVADVQGVVMPRRVYASPGGFYIRSLEHAPVHIKGHDNLVAFSGVLFDPFPLAVVEIVGVHARGAAARLDFEHGEFVVGSPFAVAALAFLGQVAVGVVGVCVYIAIDRKCV